MKRLEAIDQFRGFAILLMILANYMNNVQVDYTTGMALLVVIPV